MQSHHSGPNPFYSTSSTNQGLADSKLDKLLASIETMNTQVQVIQKQQASTMNTLNVLFHDVSNLNDEVKKLKVQKGTNNGKKNQQEETDNSRKGGKGARRRGK